MQLEELEFRQLARHAPIMAAARKQQTKIETRQFGPEIELRRADPEAGVVSGYASTFGNKDRMGSVVVAGAFTNTLRELRAKGRNLPMLLGHDQGRAVGVWDDIREDGHGLLVRGRLDLNTRDGKDARSLLQSGSISGLSIGFITRQDGSKWNKDRLELRDLDLLEVSLCPVPANPEARVTEARSMGGRPPDAVANFIQRLKAARAEIKGLHDASRT